MIRGTIAYKVAICNECGSIILYKPASEGFPHICQKCGIPWNVTPTQQQRQQMDRQQNQSHNIFVRMD
jgi:DNA-directed RNA polymerase subunit M/transcription elongation factor TFIIS